MGQDGEVGRILMDEGVRWSALFDIVETSQRGFFLSSSRWTLIMVVQLDLMKWRGSWETSMFSMPSIFSSSLHHFNLSVLWNCKHEHRLRHLSSNLFRDRIKRSHGLEAISRVSSQCLGLLVMECPRRWDLYKQHYMQATIFKHGAPGCEEIKRIEMEMVRRVPHTNRKIRCESKQTYAVYPGSLI